jgi:glutamate-1-semialdehyde 2,1-aminomutase
MKLVRSAALYKEAGKYLAGGVNSPVRAFKAVGGTPIFMKKGKGAKIFDVDNNRYIDYVMSWGALILGHTHPAVIKALKRAINSGTSFGAPTEKETEFSKMICNAIPSIEVLRLVNSGTEATMSAIRLARGYTGKDKIIKFAGAYHGHFDSLLVKAGSGAATFGISDSLGVPKSLSKDTLVLPYNNIDKVARAVKLKHKETACLIVEPVCANMGVVLPRENFLADLRELTFKYKIVLIFDEVICGFRLCFGGAQNIYKIKPDLTCLGKIIGGGLPIGAFGGRREVMQFLAPLGKVYQAGTLSGNPLAVNAGLATLKSLSKLNYQKLNTLAQGLCAGLGEILKKNNLSFSINRIGSMFTLFFARNKVYDFQTAKTSDTKKYASYFWSMLKNGIYSAPSQFEANFLSFAHKEQDTESTLAAFKKVFRG